MFRFLLVFLLLPIGAFAHELNEEEVKELARQAILEQPEVLMEAIAILEARERERAALEARAQLADLREFLENDPNAPVLGNPDGDVTVVEFFDYNCPYCREAGKVLQEAITRDPNLRVVLREWPVLGENSVIATRVSLAAMAQGRYEDMHWAMMAHQGRLDQEQALAIAAQLGLDVAKLEQDMTSDAVEQHISMSMQLANALGFNGTPSFVIGDQTAPGFVDITQLETMIAKARE